MPTPLACSDIINHQRYPIDVAQDPRRQSVVEQVRGELANDGCAVIRNFFSDAGLAALLKEAGERKAQAYFSPSKECNIYLNDGNPGFRRRDVYEYFFAQRKRSRGPRVGGPEHKGCPE